MVVFPPKLVLCLRGVIRYAKLMEIPESAGAAASFPHETESCHPDYKARKLAEICEY